MAKKKKKELSMSERHAVFVLLSHNIDASKKGGLRQGILGETAKKFDVDRTTISRFWRQMNLRMLDSDQTVDEVCKDPSFFYTCTGQRGRKIKYDRAELRKTVRKLPYKQRRTYKDLAAATGVPKTVLHAMTKSEGVFRRHTSSLKPVLTEENKVSRFEYCIEEIYGEPDRHGDYHYKDL